MLLECVGWIAPAATMVAAIMTAANLGARITGWGFAVFTIGAVAWAIEAVLTHQQNLLWSNGFLAAVDTVGIYRWLGQRAKLEKGATAAAQRSRLDDAPLFPTAALDGAPLMGPAGREAARIAGAMSECRSGRIAYLIISDPGVTANPVYRSVRWEDVGYSDGFHTRLSPEQVDDLPVIDPTSWPTAALDRS